MSFKELLSQENSNVLRGLAIMAIMLHNFFHYGFGFSSENEGNYIEENVNNFFIAINSGHTNIIAEILSFLGWIGVPVFIFLTGYGLSIKYPLQLLYKTETDKVLYDFPVNERKRYLKHSFLKLFWLMLPAILFFLLIDVIKQETWIHFIKRLSYLLMLPNLAYPLLKVNPGVYWYFGLTFQFYVFYFIARKRLSLWNLLIYSVLSIAGVYIAVMIKNPLLISWYRATFAGWFSVFAIGVWSAKYRESLNFNSSVLSETICVIILFVLIIWMNTNILAWLFIPIVALLWFCTLAKIICRVHFLKKLLVWIGHYSACIFVCHPIVRLLGRKTYTLTDNLFLTVSIYLAITFGLALVYMRIYKKLLTYSK